MFPAMLAHSQFGCQLISIVWAEVAGILTNNQYLIVVFMNMQKISFYHDSYNKLHYLINFEYNVDM